MHQKQKHGKKLVRQACHELAELIVQEIEHLVEAHKVVVETNDNMLQIFELETMPWNQDEYRQFLLDNIIGRIKNCLAAAIAENSLRQDDKFLELIQYVMEKYKAFLIKTE